MDDLTQIFKMFSDKNRLRIIAMLSNRKMCVCELAFVLDVTQPSVSRHLKKMKQAGIILDEQAGLWTNYFLNCNDSKAKAILKHVEAWLKEDDTVAGDLKKLDKADRTTICCK
ncbi:ArsR/SmtB family transcription factor [Thermodesulfobacteriota bacterium]